jgi:CRISPR-associated protein Cas2
MLHVVCYDISDDRRRDRLSRGMLDFGARVQESVFECLLDDELYDKMISRIQGIALADGDKVRVYRVCANCVEQVLIFGKGELTNDPDYYIV